MNWPPAAVLRSYCASFGAFLRTDSMPLSADALDEYISLFRIVSPLPACRRKYVSPLLAVFTTNLPAMRLLLRWESRLYIDARVCSRTPTRRPFRAWRPL